MTNKSFFHYLCRCGKGQLSNRALGRIETSFLLSSETREVKILLVVTSGSISSISLTLLWKWSAKDKGYFHSSGQEATDQHCFTHAYTWVSSVPDEGGSAPPSVSFVQLVFSNGSLDFKIWQKSSCSLFFNLWPDRLPEILPAFSISLSFEACLLISDSTLGFWLILHKKCTANSCWDLGRQRYAWPSKDVIFTVPLSILIMLSSASRLGHLTSEVSMRRCWIAEGKRHGESFLQTVQVFHTSDNWALFLLLKENKKAYVSKRISVNIISYKKRFKIYTHNKRKEHNILSISSIWHILV